MSYVSNDAVHIGWTFTLQSLRPDAWSRSCKPPPPAIRMFHAKSPSVYASAWRSSTAPADRGSFAGPANSRGHYISDIHSR